jgi:hypothetical protein
VSLINSKLGRSPFYSQMVGGWLNDPAVEVSKGDANRMFYKNFDQNITRKHGIVIEGWPLSTFDNPSSVGSQLELKVLHNSWHTGATRFRKMGDEEHMAWVENCAQLKSPSPLVTHSQSSTLSSPPLEQNNSQDPALPTSPRVLHLPMLEVIQFEQSAALPPNPDPVGHIPKPKKPRKTRSNKGKSRRKGSQVLGADAFHTTIL